MRANTTEHCTDLLTADSINELEARVRRRVGGALQDFRLVPGERGLTLQGRAPTYYVKQLAQDAVMKAAKLPICANEIVVS
jgi:hypothetical protein